MIEEATDAPKKQEELSTFNKVANVLAYPISAGFGYYAFNYTVNNQLFDHLKKMDATPTLQQKTIDFRAEVKASAFKDLPNRMKAYHASWSDTYKTRLEELGFDSIGSKLKGIHPDQRSEAVVLAFTAATIALGVGLTIANGNRFFDNLFPSKEKSR